MFPVDFALVGTTLKYFRGHNDCIVAFRSGVPYVTYSFSSYSLRYAYVRIKIMELKRIQNYFFNLNLFHWININTSLTFWTIFPYGSQSCKLLLFCDHQTSPLFCKAFEANFLVNPARTFRDWNAEKCVASCTFLRRKETQ